MQVSQAIRAIESSGPYVCTGLKGYSVCIWLQGSKTAERELSRSAPAADQQRTSADPLP